MYLIPWQLAAITSILLLPTAFALPLTWPEDEVLCVFSDKASTNKLNPLPVLCETMSDLILFLNVKMSRSLDVRLPGGRLISKRMNFCPVMKLIDFGFFFKKKKDTELTDCH